MSSIENIVDVILGRTFMATEMAHCWRLKSYVWLQPEKSTQLGQWGYGTTLIHPSIRLLIHQPIRPFIHPSTHPSPTYLFSTFSGQDHSITEDYIQPSTGFNRQLNMMFEKEIT